MKFLHAGEDETSQERRKRWRRNGRVMEERCQGYTIIASAWHISDTQQWQPMIGIMWSDGSNLAIKYPVITKYFSTEIDAEREGLEFAKKWIEDHKPNLF